MIIFAGIVSNLPGQFKSTYDTLYGERHVPTEAEFLAVYCLYSLIIVLVTLMNMQLVVFRFNILRVSDQGQKQ